MTRAFTTRARDWHGRWVRSLRAHYRFPRVPWWTVPAVLAVFVLSVFLVDAPALCAMQGFRSLDSAVGHQFAEGGYDGHGLLGLAARGITQAFTFGGILVLFGLLCFVGAIKRRRSLIRFGTTVIKATMVQAITTELIKDITGRLRPTDAIALSGGLIRDYWGCWGAGESCPSGHAAFGFLLAVLGSTYFPRHRVWWFALAGAIAAARLILLRHYVSDVWLGAWVGAYLGSVFALSYPPLPDSVLEAVARWRRSLRARTTR